MQTVTEIHRIKAADFSVHLFPREGFYSPFAIVQVEFTGEGGTHKVKAYCTIADAEQIVRDLRQALDDLPVAQEPIDIEEVT